MVPAKDVEAIYRVFRPVLMSLGTIWLGWFQTEHPMPQEAMFAVLGIIAVTSIVPWFVRRTQSFFASVNPIIDTVLISLGIYFSSGPASPLFVLYIPAIMMVGVFWSSLASLQYLAFNAILYIAIALATAAEADASLLLAVTVFIPVLLAVYLLSSTIVIAERIERERRQHLEYSQLEFKNRVHSYERLARQAQREANMDALTKLFNHGYFQTSLRSHLAEAHYYKKPIGLILLDIDDFKRLNDTYGHQFGDMVLKEVARTVKSCVRQSDVVARYGGEEMSVILPGTSKEEAKDTGERIRKAVERLVIKTESTGELVSVTASLGVSESYGGETPEVFVERADRGLYQAKNSGKNRVVAV